MTVACARILDLAERYDLGSALKRRQYEQAEYAKTELGVHIAPIADGVRARLKEIRAANKGSR